MKFLIGLFALLLVAVPVFAQDAPSGSPTEGSRLQLRERRTARQQEAAARMESRFQNILTRLSAIVTRFHEHINKIENLSNRLGGERGLDVSAVQSELAAASSDLSDGERKIAGLQTTLQSLNETTTPRDVAQTFRQGLADIRTSLHSAREHAHRALTLVKQLAASSRPRPTGVVGENP